MDHHRSLIRLSHQRYFLLLAALLWAGCISLQPVARVPSSQAVALEGVPLTKFGSQNCGAASLSAVVAFWGQSVPIDELDRSLPKGRNGGVLLLDMLLAARDLGFQADLSVGDRGIVRESVEAGRPLILMLRVFDSIGQRRDLYHYVIVDGFDPLEELVRMQYGEGSARWVSLERLSHTWEDTNFAALVLQPGGNSSTTLESIRYAVALEEQGRTDEAAALYRRIVEQEPGAVLAWVNLGNVEAAMGHEDQAETAYRQALALDPNQIDALNNLAWLLLESGHNLDEARRLATRSVSLGGPDPYLALDTLARIELASGRCQEASEAFRKALATAPPGSAAASEIQEGLDRAVSDCR